VRLTSRVNNQNECRNWLSMERRSIYALMNNAKRVTKLKSNCTGISNISMSKKHKPKKRTDARFTAIKYCFPYKF
jgi:hypothetical protein